MYIPIKIIEYRKQIPQKIPKITITPRQERTNVSPKKSLKKVQKDSDMLILHWGDNICFK
ncbi:hypothetical protein COV93_05265 [Candidatus Woesearchaeota archaeon CG11_big_fil_rev_8_21_14_0_20_43_8]|nr:MAG: hypothetical protein COV93_05265 [Candidatus Woesearchaeota archaeon CG11_big_fil_rev_8_21_14_0_20_43_8]